MLRVEIGREGERLRTRIVKAKLIRRDLFLVERHDTSVLNQVQSHVYGCAAVCNHVRLNVRTFVHNLLARSDLYAVNLKPGAVARDGAHQEMKRDYCEHYTLEDNQPERFWNYEILERLALMAC